MILNGKKSTHLIFFLFFISLIPPASIAQIQANVTEQLCLETRENFNRVKNIINNNGATVCQPQSYCCELANRVHQEKNVKVLSQLAWIQAEQREPEEAIKNFNKAIALSPNDETLYAGRGFANLIDENYNETIKDINECFQITPSCGKDWSNLNNRGMAYLRTGNFVAAKTDLDEAIRLNPNNPTVQRNKNLLEKATESVSKVKDFAVRSKTVWRTNTSSDRMTGVTTTTVFHQGKIGTGSYTVELKCDPASGNNRKPVVFIDITLHGVTAPTTRERYFSPLTREPSFSFLAHGRWRTNGKVEGVSYRQHDNWNNVFRKSIAGKGKDYSISKTGSWWNKEIQLIYDLAFEFPTSSGAIFVEIPPGEPALNKMARECVN